MFAGKEQHQLRFVFLLIILTEYSLAGEWIYYRTIQYYFSNTFHIMRELCKWQKNLRDYLHVSALMLNEFKRAN